jgi:putative intracellular protease/amidase
LPEALRSGESNADQYEACLRQWENSAVVTDQGVITSHQPSDLDAFSAKIIEEVAEGGRVRRTVAA